MGYTIGIAMSLAMGLLYGIAYMRQVRCPAIPSGYLSLTTTTAALLHEPALTSAHLPLCAPSLGCFLAQLEGNIRNTGGFLFSMNVTLIISASVAVTLQMPTDFQIILRE